MIDQEEIHNRCLSEDPEERKKALEQFKSYFPLLSDKQQAWNDLHKLTTDKDSWVRSKVASALGSVFSDLPEKQQAWNDLQKLITDEDSIVRCSATDSLGSAFPQMPDNQQVWNDLTKLTTDKDSYVRFWATYFLVSAFSQVPDKQQAWSSLIRLTTYEDTYIKHKVADFLGSAFSQVPDKQQAWNDLHKLTTAKDSYIRQGVASALTSAFSQVPDKQQAWNDIHKLTTDTYKDVRSEAVYAIVSTFSYIPDKKQVWNDLHRLTNDRNSKVRSRAAFALGSVFSYLPDRQQALNDLHRLTTDKYKNVRFEAAHALFSAFSYMPDKQQVWNDLVKLSNDKWIYVRGYTAEYISLVFSQIPDKQQVWNDLIKLTTDGDRHVRYWAADTLGTAYSQVPDKQQGWNDLIKLASDQDGLVKSYANHSLGKASIFKASQAEKEEDYKEEMEKAIKFFERSSQESNCGWWSNPAQFCLPFYRSFYSIIFEKQEAKEEVERYLKEARNAVKDSKNKKLLFEAVNNLSNALKEVQDLEKLNFEAMKDELNHYRRYCDRAAELMRDTEEIAPFATIVMRKGLPILDRNLKELLEEIQKKAKVACKESIGTDTEKIACAVSKEVQKWEMGSQEEMTWKIDNIIFTLEESIPKNPENQHIFDRIRSIREQRYIVNQFDIISTIIPLIPKLHMKQGINDLKKSVEEVNEKTTFIIKKIEEIQDELKKGFENLDKLSDKVGGAEGENIKTFSEKLLEITKRGDSEVLKRFLEEVLKNEDTFIKEIETSLATSREKEESKSSISKLRSLLKKVKNPVTEFGKDVANEIVVSYTAKGIVELVLPMMSMAIFGVPIPSQIIDILTHATAEIKNKQFP